MTKFTEAEKLFSEILFSLKKSIETLNEHDEITHCTGIIAKCLVAKIDNICDEFVLGINDASVFEKTIGSINNIISMITDNDDLSFSIELASVFVAAGNYCCLGFDFAGSHEFFTQVG